MENFFASLVRSRFPIILAFILVVFFGIKSFIELPIDAFPDLTNNQVQILTDVPGLAPLETEQLVTIPIESMMNGLTGVTQVRSKSKFGLSVVTVVFRDNLDIYFARQIVFERLQAARSRLPRGVEPQLAPLATAMGEIYHYVVEGNSFSNLELKTLQDWNIKYQLRTVPGVADVNTFGGQTQEYVVTVFPTKLQQYGVTLKEVFDALAKNNNNFGAGIIDHDAEQYTVRGIGRVSSIGDIEKIVVKTHMGAPLHLANLGRVEIGSALRQGAATKDGNGEVVTGIVMMLKGENSAKVIELIKQRIDEISKTLPSGVRIKSFYEQSALVEQTIKTVETNLVEGGCLVVAILFLMLGNMRAAIIVALSIPISMMFSFIGMRQFGITANIMSLGAVDFGMIVDGSIVMAENCLRKLSESENSSYSVFEVIQDSVREMARPILFGVLIITVVYIPILSLQGMEYKMFSPMVFTVCFALLGSLLVALTLIPVLCSFLLKSNENHSPGLFEKFVKPIYRRLLEVCLRYRMFCVAGSSVALILTVISIFFIGTEFVPELEEGNILIEARNFPSISLPKAINISTNIENTIKGVPEIKTVICRTGRPDLATEAMGVYQTDVYVMLKKHQYWRKGISKADLIEELRKRLQKEVPGCSFNFTQIIAMRVNELVSGVRSDVALKIFGDDLDELERIAAEVQKSLESIRGQRDLQTEKLSGSYELLIAADREKMARYGVNVSDIEDVAQTAVIGKPVSEVLKGRKRFDLRVKFPEGSHLAPAQVESLLIETASGKRLPLFQVADIKVKEGVDVINREFGQRRIVVQCNVRNRDLGTFVAEAQSRLSNLKLPVGYYIQWGGQFENQERAMKSLSVVIPISILIILFLLIMTFGSIKEALLVMLNVPFALIGGVIALWLRGMYLSVPAVIGFIALFGVAVLNGLVLVSSIKHLRDKGINNRNSIIEGCLTRLRPVLMTALVASFGFVPMAISMGSGAEVQKPLATVVIGGIVTSTLLTLFILPAIYSLFDSKTETRQSPTSELGS
ncbi:MAG: CusA/CzcA family heavy metal efflux RND transporter [Candidatus Melainabacteria bacterium]|nr:CusA/CzcA family heavy metal efflux RND transporter [Candidatus Melainabacteria bacterium]